MYIKKINIHNFKFFKEKFTLDFKKEVNILVGNNDAGKSTILEAISLALTGILNGKYLKNELSQYLFNKEIEKKYIESLTSDNPIAPPFILIEIFLESENSSQLAELEGNGNSDGEDACGLKFRIEFDELYQSEYEQLVSKKILKAIPIEYYKITWESFARKAISGRSIPAKLALIDSSSNRFQNGSDVYLSRIIRESLEDIEKVEISQAHRQMKESFMEESSVKNINDKIDKNANITDRNVKISVDLSTQNAWESSLMTFIDDIPFHYIGKGEQSIIKINLALSHKKSKQANILLLEEPESHLSYSKLNEIINRILINNQHKQIIISTHSSYVANKLGLDNLIFLHEGLNTKLRDLSSETMSFFKKLSGYNTLRLILCKKAILVEGDSDELIVQKAYMLTNQGKLPIDDGIDVISVGTSFLRFLEIAEKINKNVVVVTDNDGDIEAVKKKYSEYIDSSGGNIKICFDDQIDDGPLNEFNYNTLEPKFVKINGWKAVSTVLEKDCQSEDELHKYMRKNKTTCALKIFETDKKINFPQYIMDAII